jgi:metal dependent phosphohydrolase
MTANRRYRIAVQDLRLNMFVVELDRPWLDTPFLLQGFLIDDQVELDTLARYCNYVYVDLELSSPSVAMDIRVADANFGRLSAETRPMPNAIAHEPPTSPTTIIHAHSAPNSVPAPAAPAPLQPPMRRSKSASAAKKPLEYEEPKTRILGAAAPRPPRRYKPRTDARVSRETRQRFRQMVKQTANSPKDNDQGMLERMLFWITDHLAQSRELEQHRRTIQQIPELKSSGIKLTRYEVRRPMEAELPRARHAFKSGETALNALIEDIRHGNTLDMDAVAGAVDSMVDSVLDNPDAMMWIARLREEDIQVYHHGVRVALYLVALGRHLGFPRQELSYLGQIGMLADVGKTKIPRALLEKPGLLSAAEFGLVKEHVNLSLHILNSGPTLPPQVLQGISQHHERIDGSGYPNQLKGDKISIYGKMAAIADSFAALITPRPYAKASAPQDALMNLYEWSGTSFHEPLVEQFVQAIGVFPVGSLVELSSGEVAVVIAHNRVRRLEPRVLVLSEPDKTPLEVPIERDLYQESKDSRGRQKKSLRIVRGLPAGTHGFKLQDYYLDEVQTQHGSTAQSAPDAQ